MQLHKTFVALRITLVNSGFFGQSYKHFTLVNYDSRLVITSKLLILMTLESLVTSVEAL